MAYDQKNLFLMSEPSLMGDFRLWAYKSTDAIATVRANNYISNAAKMGMLRDDVVLVIDTTNHLSYWCFVVAINATGTADLTDGLAITSTNT